MSNSMGFDSSGITSDQNAHVPPVSRLFAKKLWALILRLSLGDPSVGLCGVGCGVYKNDDIVP